jgi:hypothetical protein
MTSSILAFSAASLIFVKLVCLVFKSIPLSFLNSALDNQQYVLSKSSPPKKVSPLVDLTSNTPSPNSR